MSVEEDGYSFFNGDAKQQSSYELIKSKSYTICKRIINTCIAFV